MIASRATLVGLLVVSLTTSAFAQERVCDAFTLSEYQGADGYQSQRVVRRRVPFGPQSGNSCVYDELRCLEVPVAPSDIATFAELSATFALMDQDEELARSRWAQFASVCVARYANGGTGHQRFSSILMQSPALKSASLMVWVFASKGVHVTHEWYGAVRVTRTG